MTDSTNPNEPALDRPLPLGVIVGSVRQGRLGPMVADWFLEQARDHGGFSPDLIDLAEFPLPLTLADRPPEGIGELTRRLTAAEAFVIVTPEYNHSFPASVKSLIDWHFTQWQAKPVGFVSYGGISGGLRAVEQLRLVLAEMHAVTIRDTVSFPMVWDLFDLDGQLVHPAGPNGAAKLLLDELTWWAHALSNARSDTPYTHG